MVSSVRREGGVCSLPRRWSTSKGVMELPKFPTFITFTTFTARTLHVGVMQQPAALTSTLMGPSLEARMSAYRAWAAPGRERLQ